MRQRAIFLILGAILLFVWAGDVSAQCAMCKAVIKDGQGIFGGEQAIGRGLNRGILFLLVMPYLLIFLFFRKQIVAFFKEFATAKG